MPETRFRETYQDGRLITRTAYEVADAELRRDAAEARLRSSRAAVRQARQAARTFADASGPLTAAQLTTASRQLAASVALLSQTLMDVELLLAWQEDDGAE